MPVFHIKNRNYDHLEGVISGENAADAVLKFDEFMNGSDEQDEYIRDCDDSIDAYCQQLLLEHDVTELHRHMVLEYVEWWLDGDTKTIIHL